MDTDKVKFTKEEEKMLEYYDSILSEMEKEEEEGENQEKREWYECLFTEQSIITISIILLILAFTFHWWGFLIIVGLFLIGNASRPYNN